MLNEQIAMNKETAWWSALERRVTDLLIEHHPICDEQRIRSNVKSSLLALRYGITMDFQAQITGALSSEHHTSYNVTDFPVHLLEPRVVSS